jgi:hypothetical protein
MPERDPSITPRCPSCGSEALIPDATLAVKDLVTHAKLQVGVYRKPDALVMKAPERTEAELRACGDCGFVSLFASDPAALWDAHVDRLSREFDS